MQNNGRIWVQVKKKGEFYKKSCLNTHRG
jgi:hypothetical protein